MDVGTLVVEQLRSQGLTIGLADGKITLSPVEAMTSLMLRLFQENRELINVALLKEQRCIALMREFRPHLPASLQDVPDLELARFVCVAMSEAAGKAIAAADVRASVAERPQA